MELSILNLFLVILVAWLAGLIASRFGYPSVLGELLAGIILGPPLLGLLHGSEPLSIIAELGILVMMLYIGMEIDPKELGKASRGGLLAAIGGFITPFVLCYLAVVWAGGTQMAGVFVGVAAGVTSLATKSRILVDLQLLDTRIAHVLMAGALVADTLSLIIFAAIIGVAEAGAVNLQGLAITFAGAIVFFVVAAFVGLKLVPVVARRLEGLGTTPTFTFVLLIGFLFAEGAELAGLHGVLGAFLAGLFLREQVFGRSLSHHLMDLVRHASIGFLAPIFFVTAGFAVSLDVFTTDLGLLIAVVALATLGKIAGTALFYLPTGHGWREGLVIGSGMNGRGAVEIIVAQIGLSLGLISQDVFSILVFMAIATTATVPLLLKWGTSWLKQRGELVRSAGEREGVLIVGAGPTAQTLGKALVRSQPVTVVDRNPERCQKARQAGLQAIEGDALDERVLSQAQASHIQTLIALTSNAEVNALAARTAREVFLIPQVHVVNMGDEEGHAALAAHLDISMLFGAPIDLEFWDYRLDHDLASTAEVAYDGVSSSELLEPRNGDNLGLPLALRRDDRVLPFHDGAVLEAGDRVILLQSTDEPDLPRARFNRLVENAPVLDVEEEVDVETFFQMAASALAPIVETSPEELAARFVDREMSSSTVIIPGLAIPHITLEGEGRFAILLARSLDGIQFPDQGDPVRTVFVLAGSPDQRNFHLRALATIASMAQTPEFEREWTEASDQEDLRAIVLRSPRHRLSVAGS